MSDKLLILYLFAKTLHSVEPGPAIRTPLRLAVQELVKNTSKTLLILWQVNCLFMFCVSSDNLFKECVVGYQLIKGLLEARIGRDCLEFRPTFGHTSANGYCVTYVDLQPNIAFTVTVKEMAEKTRRIIRCTI